MKSILFPVVAACLMPVVMAAEKLVVGSAAPPLVSGEYVQGEPVKVFEKDKVYLVEFWATWCGPCITGIPHLNDLHKKFAEKGLVVIGQNVWERDDTKVKPFVVKMGEKMTYRVALDDKSDGGAGKMAETWMKAAEQSGIPSAFLVDKKGMVAWIGHPAKIDDKLIGQMLDGSFDPAAHAEQMKKEEEVQGAIQENFGKLKKALAEKNIEEANKAVDALAAVDHPALAGFIPRMRLDVAMAAGDGKAVVEHAAEVLAFAEKQEDKARAAMMLSQLSSQLSAAKEVENLDPQLAVRIAEQASSMTEGKNGFVLHTLARAKFVAGDKEGAIASEEAAITHAPNEALKARMEKALASYKEGKLPESM